MNYRDRAYPDTYWDCKALAADGTANYCRDPRGEAYTEAAVFATVHAAGEMDGAAGVTQAGFSDIYYVTAVSGIVDYDDLQLSEGWYHGHDWESEVLLKVDCFIDRLDRPYCVVPPSPVHYYWPLFVEPGDLWSPSDCRWSRLDLREDAQWLEDDRPTLIGYRFDGVVEVFEASDVPLPPHRSLLPDGEYAKVVGLPDVAGCAITLEGELRCWDQEHVLDQDVPDVP